MNDVQLKPAAFVSGVLSNTVPLNRLLETLIHFGSGGDRPL